MKSAWIIYMVLVLGTGCIVSTASAGHEDVQLQDNNFASPVTVSGALLHETVTNGKVDNDTTDNTTYPAYVGFITAGVAVIFYGSNFVPVKKFETGDGM